MSWRQKVCLLWWAACVVVTGCPSTHGGDEPEDTLDASASRSDVGSTDGGEAAGADVGAFLDGASDDGSSATIDAGGTELGEPCAADAECRGAGRFCSHYPGYGHCSMLCLDASDCPAGFGCAHRAFYGLCLRACGPGLPSCPAATSCAHDGDDETLTCIPSCESHEECPAGMHCEPVAFPQRCFVPFTERTGESCEHDETCGRADRCYEERRWGFPGGTCSRQCLLPEEPGACGEGMACHRIDDTSPFGLCGPVCDDAHPCRDGFECVTEGARAVCTPRCRTDAHCHHGMRCDVLSGRCRL